MASGSLSEDNISYKSACCVILEVKETAVQEEFLCSRVFYETKRLLPAVRGAIKAEALEAILAGAALPVFSVELVRVKC